MRLSFAKWHALRNDFVIVDGRRQPVADPVRLAQFVCDRHEGVGADGLLLLLTPISPPERVLGQAPRARVRIFNADGSEAGVSGNGLRCAAAALLAETDDSTSSIVVESASGLSRHRRRGSGGDGTIVTSHFGPARFRPEEIPVEAGGSDPARLPIAFGDVTLHAACVSVGNPHAVFWEGWDESSWTEIGHRVENDPRFPERTNVEFVQVLRPDHLKVLIWERGVGRTASSGTGAAAAFAVARRKGMVEEEVRVGLEGGELIVREEPEGFSLTGPCIEVFRGALERSLDARGRS